MEFENMAKIIFKWHCVYYVHCAGEVAGGITHLLCYQFTKERNYHNVEGRKRHTGRQWGPLMCEEERRPNPFPAIILTALPAPILFFLKKGTKPYL